MALLDSHSAFPSGPFASEEALAALQRLGLRTTVSTATLLDSARSIAELATKNQAAARARFKLSSKANRDLLCWLSHIWFRACWCRCHVSQLLDLS